MSSVAKKKNITAPAVELKRRGVMLILSSPSGAGKTTISRKLLERDHGIDMSISATTRQMRPGEIDGQHYYFMDEAKFEEMVENGDFMEHARVYGNYYGTPRKPVEDALSSGRDVLFDIDWQGTRKLSEDSPDDIVSVFVLPPSRDELERRLRNRGQDSDEEIARRMAKAEDEMSHYDEYHYVIVNNEVEESIRHVQAILDAERLKRRRIMGIEAFVDGLTPEG